MGLLSFFSRKKEPENYEQILESLRLSISARQSRLSEIRQRERRATLWVTLCLLGAWVIYSSMWYQGWISALLGRDDEEAFVRSSLLATPVLVGPVVIIFTRRIVQMWYTRIGNAEEETLKKLLLEQRQKVEELKKKTDFYSTQKLLERYDKPEASLTTPAKPQPRTSVGAPGARASLGGARMGGVGVSPPHQSLGTKQIEGNPNITPKAQNHLPPPGVNGTPMPPGFMSGWSPEALQPTPRKWYDRLADTILGEDETASTPGAGAASKYALICKRCFTHNGLVREKEFETTQFLCMKCGFLNPSPASLGQGGAPNLPLSPESPMTIAHGRSSSPVSPSPAPQVMDQQPSVDNVPTTNADEESDEESPVRAKTSGRRGKGKSVAVRRSTRGARKSEAMDVDDA